MWLYDENSPVSLVGGPYALSGIFRTEQEARREAGQLNLEYELNNIPTP